MGGNALKNTVTRRYQRDEYLKLEAQVLAKLRADFPNRRIEAIKAYHQKDSFGDMDVLFENDDIQYDLCNFRDLRQYVIERFASKQAVQNGGVVSFEYQEFQIDLIGTNSTNFETSVNYFAWNDLGNLMGRIAHKLGFKYGHEGLSMTFRDGDYQYADINISKDGKTILEFLGYNWEQFQKGFDTIQDIFDFTVQTEFFNKEIYALDNRNHASRIRDRKRKTYNEFLTWVETAQGIPAYPWATMKETNGREFKQQFLERAFIFFPDFKKKYETAQAEFKLWQESRKNFNGDLVREWTGLQDKQLGNFMKYVREEYMDDLGKEQFQTFCVKSGQDGMKNWLMPIFEVYQKETSILSQEI